MSYGFYKVVHVLGLLMLFSGLAGMIVHAGTGGDRSRNPLRRALASLHGGGLVLLLVSGFGILGEVGLGFPVWAMAKLGLWLAFGALVAIPYRKPEWNGALLWLLPILGALAGYLAFYKPEL